MWTKYIIWGPLWLASFTQLRVFKTHPCCNVCPYFISFNAQIQLHWIDTLYFVYSFISGLAFLNLAILVVVKWYLIVILVFIFLMTKVVKYLFMCYWPFVCLFGEIYSWPWPVVSVMLSILVRVSSLGTSLLSDTWFADTFFYSQSCLFTFLIAFFEVQKF